MIHLLAVLESALPWLLAVTVVMFVGSLALIPWILTRLPEDFLIRASSRPLETLRHRPVLRLIAIVAKNVAGLALVVAGVVMLVTPGQGLLAIALGTMLVDVPGKQWLEQKLLREPHLLGLINRTRRRRGRPPLRTE